MIKKLFILILFLFNIACGQSLIYMGSSEDETVLIDGRTILADGDSFKVIITVTDFAASDSFYIKRNGTLIDSFYTATYIDTPLVHSTTYCYEVRRYNYLYQTSAGSQDCGTTIDTTDHTAPASISNLLASGLSPSSVQLTWTKPEAGNISIWMKIFGSSDSTEVYFGNLETYAISDLQPNTNYSFQAIFYDWNLNSSRSNIDTALTFDNSETIAGGDNLNATTAGVTSIDLIWNRVTGGVGDTITYKVYVSLNSFTDSTLISTQYNDTTYTHSGLERNTQYCYRVHSSDSVMNTLASNSDCATTDNDVTPPMTPNTLIAEGVSTSQINLTWVNPSNAKCYIYRATSSGGSYVKIDSTGLSIASYQNTGLSSNTAYWYKVSSYDEWYNESAQSTADSGLTLTPSEGDLDIPSSFAVTPNNSTGTHVLSATLDVDADSVLVMMWSYDNYQFAYDRGYIADTVVYPVSSFPLTLTGKYFGEQWSYKLAVKNDSDTSGFTGAETGEISFATGDTLYVAATAVGSGNGSSEANAMAYNQTTLNNWVAGSKAGYTILFKAGDTFNPTTIGSTPLISFSSTVGTSVAPVYIGSYGTGAKPILSKAGSSGMEVFRFSEAKHVVVENLQLTGTVALYPSTGDTVQYLKFLEADVIGSGSDYGRYDCWGEETNIVAYDSITKGYFEYITIKGGSVRNSNGDGIGYSSGGTGWWISGVDLDNIGEDGIDLGYGRGILIEYNRITNIQRSGIKIMSQRGANTDGICRFNAINYISREDVGTFFGISMRTLYDWKIYNNTIPSISMGFPVETSTMDYTFNGVMNETRNDSLFAFQFLGNEFYNNIISGTGVGNEFASGNGIKLTYKGGTRLTPVYWGQDSTQQYLRYSKFYNNLMDFRNGTWYSGNVLWRYNESPDSIYYNGSSYSYEDNREFRQISMTTYGWQYPNSWYDNFINQDADLVDNSYTNFADRGDLSLQEGSIAFGAGIYPSVAFDIDGVPIPTTGVNMGAYQTQICSVTDHFTYSGIPYENNDFLIQSGGVKTITITGHSAVTNYDSVALHVFRNDTLFMRDVEILVYDECDSVAFTLTLNVPADTVEYTYRFYRNTTKLDSASGIRIGNAYLVSGQSNAIQDVTGYEDSIAAQIPESEWLETYVGWKGRVNATEALWDWGDIGTSWAILADSLIRQQHYPVLIINGAVGGTSIGQHLTGDTYYTSMRDNIQALNQDANGWTAAYWWQGETEGDCENYATNFAELRSLWTANLGVDTLTIVQLGFNSCMSCEGGFYETQRTIADTYGDVDIIGVAGFVDFNADNCHLKYPEYKNIGTWLYRKGIYSGYDNPTVDSISYQSGVITVYFDQPITYIDSLAIDHDDYWWIDGDSLMVDTGYVANSTQVKLEVTGDPESVTTLGYLQTYQYFGGGYYRYPIIRNANRVSAILFGDVNPSNLSGIVMSEPSFTATFGSNSSLRLQGSFDTDTDTVRINQKRVSYPINAYSDSVLIVRASSGSLDTTITGSWYNDTTYYFRCTTIGDSSGSSAFSYALDTAKVPAGSGGSGAGDIFNITFEDNSLTGANGFTSTTATTNTFTVVSDTVDEGIYSAKIDPTGSSGAVVYGVRTFTTSGSVYIKGNIWLGHPTTADYAGSPLMFIDDGGGTSLAEVTIRRGTFEPGGYDFSFFGVTVSGDEDLGNTSLTIANTFGQWVEFELNWIKDATSGGMVFKLNGQTVYSELDGNTSGGTAARFVIGLGNMYNTNGNNLPNVNHYIGNIVGNSTAF